MKTIPKTPLFNPNLHLALAADVSKASSTYACELGDSLKESQASNARNDILDTLSKYRVLAKDAGYRDIVLVLEPTGGYERPLARAAWSLGLEVFYANVEAVKKLQVLQDGTASKTDLKDPRTILTVAKVGHLMRCRNLGGRWQALRQMNVQHDRLETEAARLKCRLRRLLDELFPTLDFSAQWFFGPGAARIARLYRFDPYAMREDGFAAAARRMRRCGVRASTVRRVVGAALLAVEAELDSAYVGSLTFELEEAYASLAAVQLSKATLEKRFEAIYDELLEAGEVRVRPVAQVLPKARLAMLYGESGPLEDFRCVRQLRKYAGMNARLRQSGSMKGQRKLSKKGRPLFRKILTQTCLPLVRKGELFGEEYHRRKASGQPGCKAMVAIANKYLNMLFGLHRSGEAFVASRVSVPLDRSPAEAA